MNLPSDIFDPEDIKMINDTINQYRKPSKTKPKKSAADMLLRASKEPAPIFVPSVAEEPQNGARPSPLLPRQIGAGKFIPPEQMRALMASAKNQEVITPADQAIKTDNMLKQEVAGYKMIEDTKKLQFENQETFWDKHEDIISDTLAGLVQAARVPQAFLDIGGSIADLTSSAVKLVDKDNAITKTLDSTAEWFRNSFLQKGIDWGDARIAENVKEMIRDDNLGSAILYSIGTGAEKFSVGLISMIGGFKVVSAAAEKLGLAGMAKLFNEGGTRPFGGSTYKEIFKSASRLGAWSFMTSTNDDVGSKMKDGWHGFLYGITPILAGKTSTPLRAVLVNAIANAGVSWFSGSYPQAWEEAASLAEENGQDPSNPAIRMKYLPMTSIWQTIATDLTASMGAPATQKGFKEGKRIKTLSKMYPGVSTEEVTKILAENPNGVDALNKIKWLSTQKKTEEASVRNAEKIQEEGVILERKEDIDNFEKRAVDSYNEKHKDEPLAKYADLDNVGRRALADNIAAIAKSYGKNIKRSQIIDHLNSKYDVAAVALEKAVSKKAVEDDIETGEQVQGGVVEGQEPRRSIQVEEEGSKKAGAGGILQAPETLEGLEKEPDTLSKIKTLDVPDKDGILDGIVWEMIHELGAKEAKTDIESATRNINKAIYETKDENGNTSIFSAVGNKLFTENAVEQSFERLIEGMGAKREQYIEGGQEIDINDIKFEDTKSAESWAERNFSDDSAVERLITTYNGARNVAKSLARSMVDKSARGLEIDQKDTDTLDLITNIASNQADAISKIIELREDAGLKQIESSGIKGYAEQATEFRKEADKTAVEPVVPVQEKTEIDKMLDTNRARMDKLKNELGSEFMDLFGGIKFAESVGKPELNVQRTLRMMEKLTEYGMRKIAEFGLDRARFIIEGIKDFGEGARHYLEKAWEEVTKKFKTQADVRAELKKKDDVEALRASFLKELNASKKTGKKDAIASAKKALEAAEKEPVKTEPPKVSQPIMSKSSSEDFVKGQVRVFKGATPEDMGTGSAFNVLGPIDKGGKKFIRLSRVPSKSEVVDKAGFIDVPDTPNARAMFPTELKAMMDTFRAESKISKFGTAILEKINNLENDYLASEDPKQKGRILKRIKEQIDLARMNKIPYRGHRQKLPEDVKNKTIPKREELGKYPDSGSEIDRMFGLDWNNRYDRDLIERALNSAIEAASPGPQDLALKALLKSFKRNPQMKKFGGFSPSFISRSLTGISGYVSGESSLKEMPASAWRILSKELNKLTPFRAINPTNMDLVQKRQLRSPESIEKELENAREGAAEELKDKLALSIISEITESSFGSSRSGVKISEGVELPEGVLAEQPKPDIDINLSAKQLRDVELEPIPKAYKFRVDAAAPGGIREWLALWVKDNFDKASPRTSARITRAVEWAFNRGIIETLDGMYPSQARDALRQYDKRVMDAEEVLLKQYRDSYVNSKSVESNPAYPSVAEPYIERENIRAAIELDKISSDKELADIVNEISKVDAKIADIKKSTKIPDEIERLYKKIMDWENSPARSAKDKAIINEIEHRIRTIESDLSSKGFPISPNRSEYRISFIDRPFWEPKWEDPKTIGEGNWKRLTEYDNNLKNAANEVERLRKSGASETDINNAIVREYSARTTLDRFKEYLRSTIVGRSKRTRESLTYSTSGTQVGVVVEPGSKKAKEAQKILAEKFGRNVISLTATEPAYVLEGRRQLLTLKDRLSKINARLSADRPKEISDAISRLNSLRSSVGNKYIDMLSRRNALENESRSLEDYSKRLESSLSSLPSESKLLNMTHQDLDSQIRRSLKYFGSMTGSISKNGDTIKIVNPKNDMHMVIRAGNVEGDNRIAVNKTLSSNGKLVGWDVTIDLRKAGKSTLGHETDLGHALWDMLTPAEQEMVTNNIKSKINDGEPIQEAFARLLESYKPENNKSLFAISWEKLARGWRALTGKLTINDVAKSRFDIMSRSQSGAFEKNPRFQTASQMSMKDRELYGRAVLGEIKDKDVADVIKEMALRPDAEGIKEPSNMYERMSNFARRISQVGSSIHMRLDTIVAGGRFGRVIEKHMTEDAVDAREKACRINNHLDKIMSDVASLVSDWGGVDFRETKKINTGLRTFNVTYGKLLDILAHIKANRERVKNNGFIISPERGGTDVIKLSETEMSTLESEWMQNTKTAAFINMWFRDIEPYIKKQFFDTVKEVSGKELEEIDTYFMLHTISSMARDTGPTIISKMVQNPEFIHQRTSTKEPFAVRDFMADVVGHVNKMADFVGMAPWLKKGFKITGVNNSQLSGLLSKKAGPVYFRALNDKLNQVGGEFDPHVNQDFKKVGDIMLRSMDAARLSMPKTAAKNFLAILRMLPYYNIDNLLPALTEAFGNKSMDELAENAPMLYRQIKANQTTPELGEHFGATEAERMMRKPGTKRTLERGRENLMWLFRHSDYVTRRLAYTWAKLDLQQSHPELSQIELNKQAGRYADGVAAKTLQSFFTEHRSIVSADKRLWSRGLVRYLSDMNVTLNNLMSATARLNRAKEIGDETMKLQAQKEITNNLLVAVAGTSASAALINMGSDQLSIMMHNMFGLKTQNDDKKKANMAYNFLRDFIDGSGQMIYGYNYISPIISTALTRRGQSTQITGRGLYEPLFGSYIEKLYKSAMSLRSIRTHDYNMSKSSTGKQWVNERNLKDKAIDNAINNLMDFIGETVGVPYGQARRLAAGSEYPKWSKAF